MSTDCPVCQSETIISSLPEACQTAIKPPAAIVQLCQACLHVLPMPGTPVETQWDPNDISTALPNDRDDAVAVSLLVTLLDSIALNREAIFTVVSFLEGRGVDPLSAIDHVSADETITPVADLERRRDQLAQLLT